MPSGYAGSCAVCDHDRRSEIDALIRAEVSYRKIIASGYTVSITSLSHHKQREHHLPAKSSDDVLNRKYSPDGPWIHSKFMHDLLQIIFGHDDHPPDMHQRVADFFSETPSDVEKLAVMEHLDTDIPGDLRGIRIIQLVLDGDGRRAGTADTRTDQGDVLHGLTAARLP